MEQALQQSLKKALKVAGTLRLVPPPCAGSVDGRRTGSRTGGTMEFADYRDYRQGDELRRVDWRLYARSEQLMVRRFARETDPRCDIILDCSASMDFYGKKAAAAGLGAIFARCALNGGFSLQVWGLHDPLIRISSPGEPLSWEIPDKGSSWRRESLFDELRLGMFRNGIRILISDLLFNLSPEELLRKLGGGSTVVVQILGQEELEPAFSGPMTITDPESGMSREIVADKALLERYHERLIHFQNRYAEVLRMNNAAVFFLDAAHLLENWELETFCREGVIQ